MPAWGDIVNSLLLNRQKLEQGQLNMANTAMDVMGKQVELETQQRLRDATLATTLAPPPPSGGLRSDFGSTLDATDPLMSEYKAATELVDRNRHMEDMYRGALAHKDAEVYARLGVEAENSRRQIVSKIVDKENENTQSAAQVIQGATNQDSLESAFDSLKRNYPPGVVKKVMSGFSFGNNGMPIFDAKASQVIKNLKDQYTTAHQKAEEQEADERTRDANRRAATAQAGVVENRKQRETTHQDAVTQRVYTQAETISNQYKTDDQVKQFADHKKMFTTAYNYVFDDQGNVKPESANPANPAWHNHDSASDFELSKQFIAMVHPHYRGTTYDAKELRGLANLPEHLANAIAGVATGRVLAQSDRVNMVNAMKRVLSSENEDQIQREDKALGRLNGLTRGIDVNVPLTPENYVTMYAIRPEKTPEGGQNIPEITATNPKTKEKIVSRDGGKTWQPVK